MADAPRDLRLKVWPPLIKAGEKITATIEGWNLTETVVRLDAPDTVVISPPHLHIVGTGTFKQTIEWTVEHVQEGAVGTVEITTTAGNIVQLGLCKVVA